MAAKAAAAGSVAARVATRAAKAGSAAANAAVFKKGSKNNPIDLDTDPIAEPPTWDSNYMLKALKR